jgi:acetylornithine deacetylase
VSVKENLADLVSIDSVSARPNAEIISFLEQRVKALGFFTEHHSYTDLAGIEKINLVCFAGPEADEVELALVGHTDTVPYDPNWKEATELTELEGKLYGRGSCDTKGFIAAALTAVERADVSRLRRRLALVFTADEEVGLIGAKKLSAERPFKVHYSIVGEPTSLQPIHAGKGYCLAEVFVRGREGHSAYPALGRSAIFRAARLISRLEAIAEKMRGDRHDAFDPPFTTLNVGLVRGGSAKNVIAGECRFTLEWRTVPGQPSNKLLEYLDEAIEAEKANDPEFECAVDAARADLGFETSRQSKLVTFLEHASGKIAGTVAFGTEAAPLTMLGAEAVVFGPGDIRVAHQTGEFVPADQLQRCVEILQDSIEHFCI